MKKLESSLAGVFYPKDPKVLRYSVEQLLLTAVDKSELHLPKAVIAPHAGYVYSGSTAAAVFACLSKNKEKIKRVVLFGPAHRYPVRGLALTDADVFSTPLGDIPIDKESVNEALSFPQVSVVNEAYHGENSLEVQLPFLQVLLDDYKIVPVLIGEAKNEEITDVMEKLWYGSETLIIVSSDLSHYLDYNGAKKIDADTVEAILELHPEDIGYEHACGRAGIRALLTIATKKGLEPKLIAFCNSGDVIGDKNAVVGYAGFHFNG